MLRLSFKSASLFLDASDSIVIPVDAMISVSIKVRSSSPAGAPVRRMLYLSGWIKSVGEPVISYLFERSLPIVSNFGSILSDILESSVKSFIENSLKGLFTSLDVNISTLTGSFKLSNSFFRIFLESSEINGSFTGSTSAPLNQYQH